MPLRSSRSAALALGIGAVLAFVVAPGPIAAQTVPQQLPATPPSLDRGPPAAPQFERTYGREFDRRQNHLERRLSFVRRELQITAAQQPLWDAFAETVRRGADARPRLLDDRADAFREPNRRLLGAIERVERRQQTLLDRNEYYDQLLTALRPLYGALDETQRLVADEHLFVPGPEDRYRYGRWRFGWERDFGGNRFGPFGGPFGPYPDPYNHFEWWYYR